MDVVTFRWRAKFGHFLKAEAKRNALTYPVPPRTAVLGLLGAILGLEKDSIPCSFAPVKVAVTGAQPKRFWHRVKLRKDPPSALPWSVKRGEQGRSSDEKATLISQEWLWKPDYRIHAAIPEETDLFGELEYRIRERKWYFMPCMGLSELLAEVVHEFTGKGERLPFGIHEVSGVCPENAGKLIGGDGIAVHLFRMPYQVTKDRVFSHMGYYSEHAGRPIPIETDLAWRIAGEKVVLV